MIWSLKKRTTISVCVISVSSIRYELLWLSVTISSERIHVQDITKRYMSGYFNNIIEILHIKCFFSSEYRNTFKRFQFLNLGTNFEYENSISRYEKDRGKTRKKTKKVLLTKREHICS